MAGKKWSASRLNQEEPGNELRVVLAGLSGSGKSAVANSIFKTAGYSKPIFKETTLAVSLDDICRYHKGKTSSGRDNVVVVDTPGLFEKDQQVDREVARCLLFTAPGPHAFIFVIKANRLTPEQANVVKRIEYLFGPDTDGRIIVVITGKDDLDHDYIPFETFKKKSPPHMHSLLRNKKIPVVAFNNRAFTEDNKAQVKELMNWVEKINQQKGSLTNYKCEAAEKLITDAIN